MFHLRRNIRLNMNSRKQPNKRNRKSLQKGDKRQKTAATGMPPAPSPAKTPAGTVPPERWLFGFHAVSAALANPKRQCKRLFLTADAARRTDDLFKNADQNGVDRSSLNIVRAERAEIERLLPPNAVHQGIALDCHPLAAPELGDVSYPLDQGPDIIVVLDQVTDPHNVGAILRSAASFGARAVIMQARNAPPDTGTLAKSASGALEIVPIVRVSNLSRTLETLADQGYWRIGLTADAKLNLSQADPGRRVVLVLGAEDSGLRRLTAQNCDILCKLPMAASTSVTSLNVSNAAAVALYELIR